MPAGMKCGIALLAGVVIASRVRYLSDGAMEQDGSAARPLKRAKTGTLEAIK